MQTDCWDGSELNLGGVADCAASVEVNYGVENLR